MTVQLIDGQAIKSKNHQGIMRESETIEPNNNPLCEPRSLRERISENDEKTSILY